MKFTCKRIRAKIDLKWFYFKHEIYVNKKEVSETFQTCYANSRSYFTPNLSLHLDNNIGITNALKI